MSKIKAKSVNNNEIGKKSVDYLSTVLINNKRLIECNSIVMFVF